MGKGVQLLVETSQRKTLFETHSLISAPFPFPLHVYLEKVEPLLNAFRKKPLKLLWSDVLSFAPMMW